MSSHTPDPPGSVCLCRLSAIGDVCHTVPVVRTLQAVWPATRLTWIIGRTEASLVGDLPGVEFITYDKARSWHAWRALRAALRGRTFDVLLQMQVSLRASFAATAVKAPLRVGYDRARARDFQWLFTNAAIPAQRQPHVMDGLFAFLEALGIHERHYRWEIPVAPAIRDRVAAALPGEAPVLAISPCTSERLNNFRNWRAERYAAVADHAVKRHGMQVVLTGGPSSTERAYGEAIRGAMRTKPVDLIGRTGLKELFAVLQRATVLVAPDSGPVHMATAAGTPVIGLYATSNPDRTGPYFSRRWLANRYPEAVRAEFGRSVDEIRWGRRVRDPAAMDRITVDDVTERLDALMAAPAEQRTADGSMVERLG